MSDWAKRKAVEIAFAPGWVISEDTGGIIEVIAQALREARAEGMREAAEMTWVSGDANDCCQELFEQAQFNLRARAEKIVSGEEAPK